VYRKTLPIACVAYRETWFFRTIEVTPDAKRRGEIVQGAIPNGLLQLGCGQNDARLWPPLGNTAGLVVTAPRLLDEVLPLAV